MRRRRRFLPRRRVAQSLERGQCMFELDGGCDGRVSPQGLTTDSLVLVCRAHVPRLLHLRHDLAEVRRLRRYLATRFQRVA